MAFQIHLIFVFDVNISLLFRFVHIVTLKRNLGGVMTKEHAADERRDEGGCGFPPRYKTKYYHLFICINGLARRACTNVIEH